MANTITPLGSGRGRLIPAERVRAFKDAAQVISQLNREAEADRNVAIIAIYKACDRRLAVGLKLLEIKEAFGCDFPDWLDGYCAEFFSCASAYRWMAKVNDLKAALGNPNPTFKELCDAQRATDLLPDPFSPESQVSPGTVPLFRLAFSVNSTPPQEWSSHQRREFLEKSKPIVELYAQVVAAESA